MNALYVILSVSLVFSVQAEYNETEWDVLNEIEDEDPDRPSRQCCLPEQYEGQMKELLGYAGAKPGATEVIAYSAYDFRKKLAAIIERVWTGRNSSQAYKIIANFGEKTIYFIYESRNHTCVKMALPSSEMQRCVPKNATVGRPEVLGGSLWARTYRVAFQSDLVRLGLAFTATNRGRDCLPVSEVGVGTFNSTLPIMFSAQFSNVRNKIRNPKIFTPPAQCRNATGQEIDELSVMMQFFVAKLYAAN